MRRLCPILLAALFALCLFVSCGDDDNDDPVYTIIGTWSVKDKVTAYVKTNSTENDAKIKADVLKDFEFLNTVMWTFRENGTVTTQAVTVPFKFENNKLTVHYADDDIEVYDVVMERNVLTFSFNYKDKYDDPAAITGAGITDPSAFTIEKADVVVTYQKYQQ